MTLLRRYRFASFMLSLVAMVAFAIAELDFQMLFISVVLATLSWYVTEGPRGRTLPDWMSNILVIAVLLWRGSSFLIDGDAVDAMGALGGILMWILLIKLYARRTSSEERQRFALSTMLVIAGCLESVEFAFGALVLVYGGVAIWAAMLWRLARSAETARASRQVIAGFAPPLEIAVGRRVVAQFRGIAIVSMVMVVALGTVVFVFFPRFAALGSMGGRGRTSVTGFSDEIRLRGGDRITESRRELFTVRWIDPDGTTRQLLRPLLLRGAVLTWYDANGERWVASRGEAGIRTFRTPAQNRFVALAAALKGDIGPMATAEIEMRSYASDVIFSTYAPVGVATSEPRSIALDPMTLILRDVSTDRVGRYWNYSLHVQSQPSAMVLDALAAGSSESDQYTLFPIPRMQAIASRILDEARVSETIPDTPALDADDAARFQYGREVARAIASWMRKQFTYTTDLSAFPRVVGEDPIVSFLERNRSGHCEYFASALCAVLRSLKIESRIVTGFIAIEYDERAEHYIVRESNAHAWVEVRTGVNSWTAMDATPEESLLQIQERNRSFADGFRWMYSRLEFLWNSRVVSYDSAAQSTIADRVRSGWREAFGARLAQIGASMRNIASELSLGSAGGVWFATIAIGISTALLARLIVVNRTRRLRRLLHLEAVAPAEQRRLLRDAAFYVEALHVLERAGFSKPSHLTPRAFAESLRTHHAQTADAFAAIVEQFYRIRYGPTQNRSEEAVTHRSQILALRFALSQNSQRS